MEAAANKRARLDRKNLTRRQHTQDARAAIFMMDYVKTKHEETYKEAVAFYNYVNELYPQKGDTRKTDEFKCMKNGMTFVSKQRKIVKQTYLPISTTCEHEYRIIITDDSTAEQPETLPLAIQSTTEQAETLPLAIQSTTEQAETLPLAIQSTAEQPETLPLAIQSTTEQAETLPLAIQSTTEQAETLPLAIQSTAEQPETLPLAIQSTTEQAETLPLAIQSTAEQPETLPLAIQSTTEQAETLPSTTEIPKTMELGIPLMSPQEISTMVLEENLLSTLSDQLQPILDEEIPEEIYNKILSELRQDPDLSKIMDEMEQDFNMNIEEFGEDIDLPIEEDRLERELENWEMW